MEEDKKENNKRQIAYKVMIQEIIEGEYIKQEGWDPNYILTKNNFKVSRANIIATSISSSSPDSGFSSIIIDDGSGQIAVRSFEDNNLLLGISVGDIVNVIGRPREYNKEKYIIPEIIRKVNDRKWVDLRKIEIEKRKIAPSIPSQKEKKEDIKEGKKEEYEIEKICSLIRKADSGEGVDIQDIVTKTGNPDTKEIIANMLNYGEVFEISPGKVKVLD